MRIRDGLFARKSILTGGNERKVKKGEFTGEVEVEEGTGETMKKSSGSSAVFSGEMHDLKLTPENKTAVFENSGGSSLNEIASPGNMPKF